MGLDSVELVMEIENYFNIQIPDAEAEKIYTIQNMVDVVARHLKISGNNEVLKNEVFQKLDLALLKLKLTNTSISLKDPISKYINPGDSKTWQAFENELELDVPRPDIIKSDSKSFLNRVKASMNWAPFYDWQVVTVDQFVTVVCAKNYEKLIDRNNIKNSFEIYAAVMSITVDKTGADYYEIGPEKSFTSDLGID